MYPAPFDYERPGSIDEALTLLASQSSRILAGGHSLLPGLKGRAIDTETLVDITQLSELSGIEWNGDAMTIGASTTYAEFLAHSAVRTVAPEFAEAVAAVGDRQIRNRGTIGGNVVQADPGADIPAAAVAVGASVTLRSHSGERTVPVEALYADDTEAAEWEPVATIEADELLTAIHVPHIGPGGGAYVRNTHPARGYATLGIAVRLEVANDILTDASVIAGGLERAPVRLEESEAALRDARIDDVGAIEEASDRATAGVNADTVIDDPNVSRTHRMRVLEPYVARALDTAIGRIGEEPPS